MTTRRLATLADRLEGRVQLARVCTSLGVPPRTLHNHCIAQFGMSAGRYLRQRRLQRARAALLAADPQDASVTAIALRFGFTQLGRFAAIYREAFGERPCDTLRRC